MQSKGHATEGSSSWKMRRSSCMDHRQAVVVGTGVVGVLGMPAFQPRSEAKGVQAAGVRVVGDRMMSGEEAGNSAQVGWKEWSRVGAEGSITK